MNSFLVVLHNYHDHADEPCPYPDQAAADETMLASGNAPFPLKLYYMLEHIHASGDTSIVSWSPHGRCFIVHKADEFKELLPKYYKLSKIASFQRQLNLYGFSRLTRGPDKSAYYHECFLRGKSFLIARMQRVKVKGTGVRARANPENEPDFWKMKPVGQDIEDNDDEAPQLVHYPDVSDRLQGPSSASVVSENSHDDGVSRVSHEPLHRPTFTDKDLEALTVNNKDFEPLPLNSSGYPSLTAWGMPYCYVGPSGSNAVKYEPNMTDIVDDVYLEQTLQDILKETDALFVDMLDGIVSV